MVSVSRNYVLWDANVQISIIGVAYEGPDDIVDVLGHAHSYV